MARALWRCGGSGSMGADHSVIRHIILFFCESVLERRGRSGTVPEQGALLPIVVRYQLDGVHRHNMISFSR